MLFPAPAALVLDRSLPGVRFRFAPNLPRAAAESARFCVDMSPRRREFCFETLSMKEFVSEAVPAVSSVGI